jgi:hypothetical protein
MGLIDILNYIGNIKCLKDEDLFSIKYFISEEII